MAARSRRTSRRDGDGGTRTRGSRATRGDGGTDSTTIVITVGVAVVVLAAVAVYFFVLAGDDRSTRPSAPPPPPKVEDAIAEFEKAWKANDADAIGAMTSHRSRRGVIRMVQKLPEKNDWTDGLATLGEPTIERNDFEPPQVLITYPIVDRPRSEVVIRFELVDKKRWVLRKLSAGLKD